MVDVGPQWVRNAATAFGVVAWLCLGGLWVAVPAGLVVCLLAAAVSTSVGAFCSVLLRRPIWHILGYGLLAALGLNLIVVEIAYGWTFVWPLYFVVLLYGQLSAVWLAAMLLLSNWPELGPAVAAGVSVVVGVFVALLELLLSSSGAVAFVLPGLVIVTTVAAATGTLRGRNLAGPPWWSVPAGLLVVAVSIWGTTAWLLAAAEGTPALRVDAIQTGLVMGVVAGAGFVVLLGVYSRWTSGRSRAPADPVAAVTAVDAVPVAGPVAERATGAEAARPVSDLFAAAASHLRDNQAAVRLAGLMTLEKLARDHPEHRPTVVSVLGAYLRTPARGGPAGLTPEERKVRLAARDVLAKTLQADAPAGWRVVADPLSDGKAFRLVSEPADTGKA
ncbi:hypothetical protein GCM10027569_07040 [Flindersiella endophytica]